MRWEAKLSENQNSTRLSNCTRRVCYSFGSQNESAAMRRDPKSQLVAQPCFDRRCSARWVTKRPKGNKERERAAKRDH